MSTDNTIASTTPQVDYNFFTTVDNNLRVTSPDGKIPHTPYFDFTGYFSQTPSQMVHAATVTPNETITPTGIAFCNPS